jgi:hypothetical protein
MCFYSSKNNKNGQGVTAHSLHKHLFYFKFRIANYIFLRSDFNIDFLLIISIATKLPLSKGLLRSVALFNAQIITEHFFCVNVQHRTAGVRFRTPAIVFFL